MSATSVNPHMEIRVSPHEFNLAWRFSNEQLWQSMSTTSETVDYLTDDQVADWTPMAPAATQLPERVQIGVEGWFHGRVTAGTWDPKSERVTSVELDLLPVESVDVAKGVQAGEAA